MSEQVETPLNVYQCIAAVSAEIAKAGISKSRENKQQGYSFRGIDDVYNCLAPILATHKLVILPRMHKREMIERATKNGGALFYVTVEAAFDFVSAADGSKTTVNTYGEAMDTGDKATNKAMSAAYKYAAMQTFCIPTEGDHDSENQTHEVAPAVATNPAGYDDWLIDFSLVAPEGLEALRDAFKKSKAEYRNHLTKNDTACYDKIIATATAASAKPQPVGA